MHSYALLGVLLKDAPGSGQAERNGRSARRHAAVKLPPHIPVSPVGHCCSASRSWMASRFAFWRQESPVAFGHVGSEAAVNDIVSNAVRDLIANECVRHSLQ